MQTIADGEAEQAENKATYLQKQLQEQKKLLGSKEKEASKLQADLAKEQQRVDIVTQQSVLPRVQVILSKNCQAPFKLILVYFIEKHLVAEQAKQLI